MATRIAIDTAKIMMKKLQGKLDALYEEQESLKGMEEMKCGGKVRARKMKLGGKNPIMPVLGTGVDPTKLGEVIPQTPNPNQNPSAKDVLTPWERILGGGRRATDWLGDNAGDIGYGLGVAAPSIYNLIQGLKKPDLLDPKDFYNSQRNKAMSLMANRRVNVAPMLEANKATQATYNSNVEEVAGGNRSKLLGGFGAGQNRRMASDAEALAYKQNQDLGYMGEEAQFRYGVGQDMSNIDFSVAGINQEAKAARRGYLGQAASDFSNMLQSNRLMKNQKIRDEQLMDIYPDIFGKVAEFMPWLNNFKV